MVKMKKGKAKERNLETPRKAYARTNLTQELHKGARWGKPRTQRESSHEKRKRSQTRLFKAAPSSSRQHGKDAKRFRAEFDQSR